MTRSARRAANPAPACIFQEPGLIERTARDFTDEVNQVLATTRTTERSARRTRSPAAPNAASHAHRHPADLRAHRHRSIHEAFSRQAWLPCGGYIVIDETRPHRHRRQHRPQSRLQDVDKMTRNQHRGRRKSPTTRLRNIGGLAVIDHRHAPPQGPTDGLQDHQGPLKKDKAKTQVPDLAHRPDGNDLPALKRIAARFDA
jgi:ribonuclease G